MGGWGGMPFEASPPGPLSVTGEGEEDKENLCFAFLPLSRSGEGAGG
jgi:hypothetical protein